MHFHRIGTIAAGAVAATTLAVSPTFAATNPNLSISSGGGTHSASFTLTWYNRSVGVQGGVTDTGGAGTLVQFNALVGGYIVPVDIQTRPTGGQFAVNETVSYNFTLDGSAYVGGITEVDVWIYDAHADLWSGPNKYLRP